MIGWAVETMVAVSALLLLVLLIRRPVARAAGAVWAYALWLLPLLRVVTPPLGTDLPATLPPVIVMLAAEPGSATTQFVERTDWAPLLMLLWIGGALIFAAWQVLRYLAFVAQVEATLRPSYPASYEGIPLIESRAVEGPIAIGLLQPRIVLPYDFLSRYEPAEQRLALRHEWVHHRRGDLWWNLAALAMLALNWFNPLAWIAFRAFRADQELACDAAVLAGAPDPSRHAYGLALVKAASRPGLLAACPLNSTDQLKRRLSMLKSHRVSTLRSVAGALIVAGTFATGLCLSAPTLAQDAKGEPVKERKIMIKQIGKEGGMTEITSELRERLSRCPEAQRLESDVRSGEGAEQQRTRVILCTEDGKAPGPETREKLAAAIDRARAELEGDAKLSPDQRSKAVEALRREVDRIRSEGK